MRTGVASDSFARRRDVLIPIARIEADLPSMAPVPTEHVHEHVHEHEHEHEYAEEGPSC
jgi:hypothetical protein